MTRTPRGVESSATIDVDTQTDSDDHDAFGVLAASSTRAHTAIDAAKIIASRLREVEDAQRAFDVAQGQLSPLRLGPWRRFGLAQGHTGLALLFGALDALEPAEGWDVVAHTHLRVAVEGLGRGRAIGLYDGLAGIGAVAQELSRGGTRYTKLLNAIDETLARAIQPLTDVLKDPRGAPVGAFDLISGLTGIGTYLLSRRGHRTADRATIAALEALVGLTEAADPPKWKTPAWAIADELMLGRYPEGNVNCGLAHGGPGILALLASAETQAYRIDGLRESVACTARWLEAAALQDDSGPAWAEAVPLGRETGAPALSAGRSTWCYGAPGVAQAMWMAGEALDVTSFQELAVAATRAAHARPNALRQVPSPSLCHGQAGLAACTQRLGERASDVLLQDAALSLVDSLLTAFDPDLPVGWQIVHREGRLIDSPGFLDGASGICLFVLSATTAASWGWSRSLLLV